MTETGTIRQDASTAGEWVQRRRLLLSLLALLILITVLLGALSPNEPMQQPWRTSLSRDGDGYFALHEVLERLGYRVERSRRSYGALGPHDASTLVLLDPIPASVLLRRGSLPMDHGQARTLRQWVRHGGVLLATLPGKDVVRLFDRRLELRDESIEPDEPLAMAWPGPIPETREVVATGAVVVREGLEVEPFPMRLPAGSARVVPSFVETGPGASVTIRAFTNDLPADVRVEASLGDAPIAISAPAGEGRVWLLSTPLPMSNFGLGRAGCGELAVALVDAATGRGRRRVILDEYGHGLGRRLGLWWYAMHSDLRHPLLAVLLAAIVIAWRGVFRLGSPRPELAAPRRAVEEFVVSLADLSHRAGRRRSAAQRILRTYATRLRARRGARVADTISEWPEELRTLAVEVESAHDLGPVEFRAFVARAEQAYRTGMQQPPRNPSPA